jgi:deoxycytidine triphosphate deaminase
MLGDVDLRRRLKKGSIAIYPFKNDNIESASVGVSASEYAWSLSTKDRLELLDESQLATGYTKNNKIFSKFLRVPSGEVIIIATEEAIHSDEWIAGTVHSRVGLTIEGFGHIGTPMKPWRTGRLFIAIFNQTKKELFIGVGEKIAVIMFHELAKKSKIKESSSAKRNLLEEMGFNGATSYDLWEFGSTNADELKKRMKTDSNYQDYMKSKGSFAAFLYSNYRYIIAVFVCLLFAGALLYLSQTLSQEWLLALLTLPLTIAGIVVDRIIR